MRFVQHNRIKLALYTLREASTGRALLLLHGLGERSPRALPAAYAAWGGPVYALDFTGHGASTVPKGGGYGCELLTGDVDAVLASVGACTLAGRGLGGYVALLTAGARPALVHGALILDGPGLAGGGSAVVSSFVPFVDDKTPGPPDPFALIELATDVRPPDYAAIFVRQALQFSRLERPISVCARDRPLWLQRVLQEPGVAAVPLGEALAYHAAL